MKGNTVVMAGFVFFKGCIIEHSVETDCKAISWRYAE